MNDERDLQLVKQTLEGDRSAFGQLVEEYQMAVVTVAYNVLGNRKDAEDAAQVAFMKAFEQLASFKSDFRFFSWLYRIAVNEAINAKKKRRPLVGTDHIEAESTERSDRMTEVNELEDRIDQALMDLSPEDRALILLRHYQNFSYPDIAYIMDITEKKVKSRLFTARQRLRGIFETRGITAQA